MSGSNRRIRSKKNKSRRDSCVSEEDESKKEFREGGSYLGRIL